MKREEYCTYTETISHRAREIQSEISLLYLGFQGRVPSNVKEGRKMANKSLQETSR